MLDSFDFAASEKWQQEVRANWRRAGEPSPLVSVIMPTKNRAQEVQVAARSVLAQTYTNFELLIVDDASTDGTLDALGEIASDSRVRVIRRETSAGVAIARNTGLKVATGHYVAYLDSDNTWVPEFLELMIAFLTTRPLRAAYCVSELKGEEQHYFRALPYDYDVLRERNYIDCIVLLHERSLLDEVGMFDERLRRMVDWDLLIRIGSVTDLELAPFVGTIYDLWEDRPDRISNSEPWGHRYVIKAKQYLDWDAAQSTPRDADLVSVVITARGRAQHLEECVARLLKQLPHDGIEVVVVDSGTGAGTFYRVQLLAIREPRVRVVRIPDQVPFELATDVGIIASNGGTVVILESNILVEAGWLDPLLRALDGGAAAAGPLLLKASGAVASAGVAFAAPTILYDLFEDHAGESEEANRAGERAGLRSSCLAARAEDLITVRGLDPFFVNAGHLPDLSMQLSAVTGRGLLFEPSSVAIQLDSAKKQKDVETETDNRNYFAARWSTTVRPDSAELLREAGFVAVGHRTVEASVSEHGIAVRRPVLVHDRPGRPLRWAIKIAAPDVVDRRGWGDHYFAVGLSEALRRRGQHVVVDGVKAWHRDGAYLDDVVLVLRGKKPYVPDPHQVNLAWLISHPEWVKPHEFASFDRVLVASSQYTDVLAKAYGDRVETMLQCTDPAYFRPGEADPVRVHDVLFVGNSRGVERPTVRDAIQAGLDVAVYGRGWEEILPAGVIKGTYVPNSELAATYRAAGVVLNDHWDDMRRNGFLSNRLFDLAACGAKVVSDEVPGLHDVFGSVIATYSTPNEIAETVRDQTKDDDQRLAARAALSEQVRSEHSFDARAGRLIGLVESILYESRPDRRRQLR
jgi:glycosyltransferase involved in cell wall biosynthesis